MIRWRSGVQCCVDQLNGRSDIGLRPASMDAQAFLPIINEMDPMSKSEKSVIVRTGRKQRKQTKPQRKKSKFFNS